MNTLFNAGSNKVAKSIQMCFTSHHENESRQDINVNFTFTVSFSALVLESKVLILLYSKYSLN